MNDFQASGEVNLHLPPSDENKSPLVEIKNLREKFTKVYEDLQKNAKFQEEVS